MNLEEIRLLASRIGRGEYEQQELDQFLEFLKSSDPVQAEEVLDLYKKALDQQHTHSLRVSPDFMQKLRALGTESGINRRTEPHQPSNFKRIIHFRRTAFAAAAAVTVIILAVLFNRPKETREQVLPVQVVTDVAAPKTNRATITLAGGGKIYLDSAANGTLAIQGNVQVRKLGSGKIAYSGTTTTMSYNTLTNPRGSQPVTMTLSDGSQVWLNTGSSLTFPVAFFSKERNVVITGEAYFEIAHNAAMPFTVSKLNDDASIQVLGTHFNVNAYDDESAIRVTLLEGSVNVRKADHSIRLIPSEQAEVQGNRIKVKKNVDTDEVMAWKNGKFQFGDATDINTVMRQLSRWYDVDITMQGDLKGSLGGSISRDVNVSRVLKMLETTGLIKYKIDGNKVTIMPGNP